MIIDKGPYTQVILPFYAWKHTESGCLKKHLFTETNGISTIYFCNAIDYYSQFIQHNMRIYHLYYHYGHKYADDYNRTGINVFRVFLDYIYNNSKDTPEVKWQKPRIYREKGEALFPETFIYGIRDVITWKYHTNIPMRIYLQNDLHKFLKEIEQCKQLKQDEFDLENTFSTQPDNFKEDICNIETEFWVNMESALGLKKESILKRTKEELALKYLKRQIEFKKKRRYRHVTCEQ